MENMTEYYYTAKAITIVFLLAVSLTWTCGYANAQGFDISVTFRVTQWHPNVPTSTGDRPRNGPISTIGVDPNNEQNVLVASETGGLFRSRDGAVNWRHEDSLPSSNTVDIAYLPRNRIIVTAAPAFDVRGGGVWLQGAGGSGWTNIARVASIFPDPGAQCAPAGAYGIAIAPDTGQIYIATDCGVAIGSPDAATWRHVEIPGASLFRSITSLGNGHLIIGGQAGIWYSRDSGTNWIRETTGIGNTSSIHGLTRDPRGGDRGYVVNDSKQLYETTDGGVTWLPITSDPGTNDAGGIAFVRVALDRSRVRLYLGNRYSTRMTSFDVLTEPTAVVLSWTGLIPRHTDTRDLAFHPGTANPYLMSSDGGLETTSDGINFDWISPPANGLEANVITDIRGQYIGGSPPDLYFSTWHNGVYAVGSLGNSGNCPEGWGLQLLRRVPTAAGVKISTACMGMHNLTPPLFAGPRPIPTWPESAQRLLPPVILGPGAYVQQSAPSTAFPLRRNGLQYTTNTGETWRPIADIAEPLRDVPKPAGPATNPTVVQAVQTGTTPQGQQIVGLAIVSDFASGGTATRKYAYMENFGSIGVMPFEMFFEVFAVDPNDAAHIIAADGLGNVVKVSHDGGDHWRKIEGLTDMVSHGGEYRLGKPEVDRTASLVSAISFCPDNSSRVLIGTQQGGAYFSFDGGGTWQPVAGSDALVYTTSFFWLSGCGGAMVSTYGRGLWRIDMTLTSALDQTTLLCNHCPWEPITRELLHDDHPDPKSIQTLIVVDGRITAVNPSNGATTVTVSPGSVLFTYGVLSNLKIVYDQDAVLPETSVAKGGVIQGLFFKDNKMSPVNGVSPLELYMKTPGKMGPGKSDTPFSQRPSIEVVTKSWAYGAPAVKSGDPLIVRVNNLGSWQKEALQLQIDGNDAAKVDTSQKTFEYIDKGTQWALGRHVVALVSHSSNGPQTVWVTDFLVPHNDEEREQVTPAGPETKPEIEPSKPERSEPPERKEAIVTAVSLTSAPEKYQGPCPVTIKFSGEITFSGKGIVTYALTRSDGAAGPIETLFFDDAGTKMVSSVWTLGGPGLAIFDGWQAIRILSPNRIESGHASFSFRCLEDQK
ncbi:MAG: hypothetical protein ABIP75_01165 [Pyrinomonadaceae bacterium]